MDIETINAAVGRVADIEYTTRDLGHGSKTDMITGFLTGTCDAWGKWTIAEPSTHKALYLFADEITGITILATKDLDHMYVN